MVSPVLAQAIVNQQAPNIVGAFTEGREFARGQRVRGLAGQVLREGGGDALSELKDLDPQIALALGESIQAQSARDLNDFIRDAKITQNFLLNNDVPGTMTFLQQRRNLLQRQGRSTTETDELLSQLEVGNIEGALNNVRAFTQALEQVKIPPVQSSKILPDGTAIEVLRDNSTQVVSPEGEILRGEDRVAAIKRAEQFGIEIATERARSITETEELTKERVGVRKNIFSSARQARKTLSEIKSLRSALQNVKTGRISLAREKLGTLIPGLRTADAEALTSAVNEFVLRRKDELLGGGILSDADIALLQGIGPQLGNTIEANLAIIDRFENVADNSIERAKRLKRFKGDALEFDINDNEEGERPPEGLSTGTSLPVQTPIVVDF